MAVWLGSWDAQGAAFYQRLGGSRNTERVGRGGERWLCPDAGRHGVTRFQGRSSARASSSQGKTLPTPSPERQQPQGLAAGLTPALGSQSCSLRGPWARQAGQAVSPQAHRWPSFLLPCHGCPEGVQQRRRPRCLPFWGTCQRTGGDELKTGQWRLRRPPMRSKDVHLPTPHAIIGNNSERCS